MNNDLKQRLMMMLALFLTFVLWMEFMTKRNPEKQPDQKTPTATAENTAKTESVAKTTLATTPQPAGNPQTIGEPTSGSTASQVFDDITIKTEEFEAVFTTRRGAMKQYRLNNFFLTPEHEEGAEVVLVDEMRDGGLSMALDSIGEAKLRNLNYSLVSVPHGNMENLPKGVTENDSGEVTFRTKVNNWTITKTFSFPSKRRFGFIMRVTIENDAEVARDLTYKLVGAANVIPDDKGRWGMLEGVSGVQNSPETPEVAVSRNQIQSMEPGDEPESNRDGRVVWVGLKNRFFAAIMSRDGNFKVDSHIVAFKPDDKYLEDNKDLKKLFDVNPVNAESMLATFPQTIPAGGLVKHEYGFYGGPAEDAILAADDERFNNVVSYTVSWFDPISRLLMKALNMLAGWIGNYGIAIILLTLIVKSCLHPLTRKAMVSGRKMQSVAPKVKALQEKYKNDRAKAQQEIMRVYREEGVSPMGGCLPMLIQMPIFFALYGAFARGFAGRQANFISGWISDLSQPDAIWTWGTEIWMIGDSFNLLPIFYLVLSILHMDLQPKSSDPQMAQQQKMMKFMPVLFFFIFYQMPSGLVLYFTVSSGYTIVEHLIIRHCLPDAPDGDAANAQTTVSAPVAAGTGISGGKGKKKRN